MHIYRKRGGVTYGAETVDIYFYYYTGSLQEIADLFRYGQSPGLFYQRTINGLYKEKLTVDSAAFSNRLFPVRLTVFGLLFSIIIHI